MILIGNKCDLEDETQVGLDEIVKKNEELKIECFETSVITGEGIEEAAKSGVLAGFPGEGSEESFETLFTKFLKKFDKGNSSKRKKLKMINLILEIAALYFKILFFFHLMFF